MLHTNYLLNLRIFLGYCPHTKGYRCYEPLSQKVYTSRHVKFVESEFPYLSLLQNPTSAEFSSSMSTSSLYFDVTLASENSVPFSIPSVPLSTTTSVTPSTVSPPSSDSISSFEHSVSSSSLLPLSTNSPSPLPPVPISSPAPHPMMTRSKHGIYKPNVPFSLSLTTSPSSPIIPEPSEPTLFSEAIKCPQWKKAMSTEYEALLSQRYLVSRTTSFICKCDRLSLDF